MRFNKIFLITFLIFFFTNSYIFSAYKNNSIFRKGSILKFSGEEDEIPSLRRLVRDLNYTLNVFPTDKKTYKQHIAVLLPKITYSVIGYYEDFEGDEKKSPLFFSTPFRNFLIKNKLYNSKASKSKNPKEIYENTISNLGDIYIHEKK